MISRIVFTKYSSFLFIPIGGCRHTRLPSSAVHFLVPIKYLHSDKNIRSPTTLNQSYVDPFANVSKSGKWWDVQPDMQPLYQSHIARMPYIKKQIMDRHNLNDKDPNKPFDGLHILDVGCGCGLISEDLAKLGAKVTAFDVGEEIIQLAKDHAKLNPSVDSLVNYSVTTIEEFCQTNNEIFDVVIVAHVLDYVTNPFYFLKLCCERTKPGGMIFVQVKNKTIYTYLKAMYHIYFTKFLKKDMVKWKNFFKRNEITKEIEKHGFYEISYMGEKFLNYKITLSNTKYFAMCFSISATKKI